ncbi:MAG: glycosyltransferase family 9 protein, partial [Mailhella sp.]|nr:glycosyltransferase family 9 protein [Mailhella sp.]
MKDLSSFQPKRILVCQQRQIGDVLLSTPVFQLLKQRFPEAELHLFTEAKCEPLLRHNPFIDKFHLVEKKGFLGELAFYRKVAKHGFDMVLNLQNLPRCRMMTLLSGAPVRLSMKTGSWRDWIYTHTVPEVKGYAAMSKISLLKDFGITWNGEPPRIFFTPEEECEASTILTACGLRDEHKLITIDGTHRRPLKRWPIENFAKVIGMLAEHDSSYRFLLLRGPGEEADVKALRDACPCPERILIPEKLPSIRLSAACIKKAVIHIGNGSSPQHMAVACDTPS